MHCKQSYLQISDHHAQFLVIPNYITTHNSRENIYRQNLSHFNSKQLLTDLEKVNWGNTVNVLENLM